MSARARRAGLSRAQLAERGDRCFTQLLGLLLDARRAVDRASAQPALDVVDGRAREARVRRAEEREQLAARRVRPRVAQQLQQRVPERRVAETHPRLERARNAEAAEHRLERRAPAVERRRDERDPLGGRARAQQCRGSPRRSAPACRAGRRPRRSARRRRSPRRRRRLAEERALEVRERGMRVLGRARRQLLDAPGRSAERSSAVRCSDANTSRPGSYGSETCTSARPASASSSAHCALVRSSNPYAKTGSPCHASRSDWRRSAARRRSRSRSQSAEAVELAAVALVELRQVAVEIGRDRAGRTRARRASAAARRRNRSCAPRRQPVQRGAADRAAHDQRALVIGRDRPAAGVVADEQLEQAVEGDDLAAEEAAVPREQVALDAIDVRRIRHDQNRLVVEDAPDSARAGARLCPRSQARRGGTAPPSHRRAATGRVPMAAPSGFPAVSGPLEASALGLGARPAAAAGGGAARHLPGALVAEIGHLRAAAGVGIRHAQRRTLGLVDLLAAVVTDEHCFPRQIRLLGGFGD